MEMKLLFKQPPPVLGPNGRACWAGRARQVKITRSGARLVVLSVLRADADQWAGWSPRVYGVTWYYWSGVGPDVDNVVARCKALLDGCADAFGINDRSLELGRVNRVKVRRADARAGMVELCFRSEEGEMTYGLD